MTDSRIPVADLARRYRANRHLIDPALARVTASGWYVLGHEVEEFETAFANWLDVDAAIGVSNGTDAITLALMACDIGPGDEVITTAMTAVPTANGITAAGATVRLCDMDPVTYCLDPAGLEAALTSRTRAIIPVHLYGQMAPMGPILAFARQHGLRVIEDAAQAHGARQRNRRAGTLGAIGCFSFYPTKNLGALGDAGACVTDDVQLADRLRLLRNYGQRTRYEHVIVGRNARLDELQAAVLAALLPELETVTQRRQAIARRYNAAFAPLADQGRVRLPAVAPENDHVWHLYTLRVAERDGLRNALDRLDISTQIHYPIPVHLQAAYASLGYPAGSFPEAESHARTTVSLPLFPELTDAEADRVIASVISTLAVA